VAEQLSPGDANTTRTGREVSLHQHGKSLLSLRVLILAVLVVKRAHLWRRTPSFRVLSLDRWVVSPPRQTTTIKLSAATSIFFELYSLELLSSPKMVKCRLPIQQIFQE